MTIGRRRSLAAFPLFASVVLGASVATSPAHPSPQTKAVPAVFVAAVRTTRETQVLRPCSPPQPSPAYDPAVLGHSSPGSEIVPVEGNWLPGGVPDREARAEAEREIARSGKYRVAASPEEAELVLFLQSSWRAIARGRMETKLEHGRTMLNTITLPRDVEPNEEESEVALAVPAAAYRQDPADGAALVKVAIWGRIVGSCSLEPIRHVPPASLAAEFVREKKRHAVGGLWSLPHPRRAPIVRAEVLNSAPAGLVAVPVEVTDSKGEPVPGLGASDFRLFEDDVEQRAESISSGPGALSLALLLDSSISMLSKSRQVRTAASALYGALPADDRLMTVAFDSRIRVVGSFASSREAVRGLLSGAWIGGETTRLYDAVAATLDRLDLTPDPKAVLIVSDGLDVGSGFTDHARLLARLQASNVAVNVVQVNTVGDRVPASITGTTMSFHGATAPIDNLDKGAAFARATGNLQALARATGGRFESAALGVEIADRMTRIVNGLHRGYVLYYAPAARPDDGRVRRIRVEVARPDAQVRARSEYRPLSHTAGQEPRSHDCTIAR